MTERKYYPFINNIDAEVSLMVQEAHERWRAESERLMMEWYMARKSALTTLSGTPEYSAALDRLAKAESALHHRMEGKV